MEQQDFLGQNKNILKDEEGQAAIEFILVFAFALGITFLFIHMALNFTVGYLAHYANFMASRTYLTYDASSNNPSSNFTAARNKAEKTLQQYHLDAFEVPLDTFKVWQTQDNAPNAAFVGTTLNFSKVLSPLKMVGGKEKALFVTESFLGKEPLRITCWERVCNAVGKSNCDMMMEVTLFDNGC